MSSAPPRQEPWLWLPAARNAIRALLLRAPETSRSAEVRSVPKLALDALRGLRGVFGRLQAALPSLRRCCNEPLASPVSSSAGVWPFLPKGTQKVGEISALEMERYLSERAVSG